MANQTSTKVRTDDLDLLISGIRRSLMLYENDIKIAVGDSRLHLHDINTGQVCEMKFSSNVTIRGEESFEVDDEFKNRAQSYSKIHTEEGIRYYIQVNKDKFKDKSYELFRLKEDSPDRFGNIRHLVNDIEELKYTDRVLHYALNIVIEKESD